MSISAPSFFSPFAPLCALRVTSTSSVRRFVVSLTLLFLFTLTARAQDSLSADPFDAAAFDQAVTSGDSSNAQNKLEYLPGISLVSEATGYRSLDRAEYGSDARFFGKAFIKASKADVGALYLAGNFSYFLYAAANNDFFRSYYQVQRPDPTSLAVSLSELHLSFDIRKYIFLRAGKQLISWGATYFWSPADFINQQRALASVLSVVDIRAGKPGLRIHVPIQPINVFLFTDFSRVVKNGKPQDFGATVAQAWRIDGTLGGVNLGTVGYIAQDKPTQIGFDATGALLGADLYGECALSFAQQSDSGPDFAMSAGGSRAFGTEKEWTARGEFYYNDNGYEDTDLSTLDSGSVFIPFYSGKYYLYAEVSTVKLMTSILGASVYGFINLADLSHSATLQLSLSIPGVLPFAVYGRYYGGNDNREFTSIYGGRVVQAGLRVRAEF